MVTGNALITHAPLAGVDQIPTIEVDASHLWWAAA